MGGAALVMFALSIMLILEYRFFHHQTARLLEIKSEYEACISEMRRIMDAHNDCEIAEGDEKKKLNDSGSEDTFIVVNREQHYLRKSAVTFAQQYNLADAVSRLYDDVPEQTGSRRRASKKRRQKNVKNYTYRPSNIQVKEPIFHLPIDKGSFWLSSPFGPRKNPNGTWGFHYGIDMAAVKGTPVKAAGSGKVITACYQKGYGNTVVILHDNKFKTRYAHLQKIKTKVGAHVQQSEIIGTVGDTGHVRKRGRDASHLHFEVIVNETRANPFYFLI